MATKKSLMDLGQYTDSHSGGKTIKPDESIGTNTDQDASKIEKMANSYDKLDPDYLKKLKPKKMMEHLLRYAKELIKESDEQQASMVFNTDNSAFNGKKSTKEYSKAPDTKFCNNKKSK